MKSLLSLVYAARALAVLVFLLAPKTGPVMLIFAAVIGLTYLSTVPPTAGLVAKFFGPAQHGHAVRHRDADAPGRRLPRRLAGRQGVRVDRQLRLDVVRRHRARGRRRADPPADPRGACRARARLSSTAALNPRTRALLEAPILPTLLRLGAPNVLVMLAQAGVGLIET